VAAQIYQVVVRDTAARSRPSDVAAFYGEKSAACKRAGAAKAALSSGGNVAGDVQRLISNVGGYRAGGDNRRRDGPVTGDATYAPFAAVQGADGPAIQYRAAADRISRRRTGGVIPQGALNRKGPSGADANAALHSQQTAAGYVQRRDGSRVDFVPIVSAVPPPPSSTLVARVTVGCADR
jgi:hypothetical protein